MKHLRFLLLVGMIGAALSVFGHTSPALAFGDWLRRDGACAQPHEPHVRHRVVRQHVVERPGVYVIERRPGLYGWRKVRVRTPSGRVVVQKKRVLLRPYKNVVRYRKPKERWVHERQRVTAAAPPRPRGAWPDGC